MVNYSEEYVGSEQDVEVEYIVKCFGIEFAPFNVPFRRRVEIIAVAIWTCYHFSGILLNLAIVSAALTNIFLAWIPLLYIIWIYFDRNTASTGGRKIRLARRLQIWKHIRDYFPINLIKTTDLPGRTNYIFCVHPHGLSAFGTLINFGTEANEFGKLYVGLDPYVLDSSLLFYVPFTRETLLSLGGCAITEGSVLKLLENPTDGKVAIINSGGVIEMLRAKPSTYDLVVNYDMVEYAVKSGAPLVPVISFGENDIYDELKHRYLDKIAEFVHKYVGYKPLFLIGRGFFQYTFGILPHRRPINTVVGKPISVQKNPNPTRQELYDYYNLYRTKLEELFNEHKQTYIENIDRVEFKAE